MKISNLLIFLSVLTALMGAIAAGLGLFYQGVEAPFEFTTLRGNTVQIYGRGLYRFDTLFFGAGYKGQDAVALFLGVPLLVLSILWYRQGSLLGHFLLTGMLGYFLYLYSSMALGAAYNPLFLLYTAIFSTSLFGFILAFNQASLRLGAWDKLSGLPGKGVAIFMFLAGAVTLFVWGAPIVGALVEGVPPDRMDSYTTMVTYALDLALITPATIVCGVMVLQDNAVGYVLAAPLLILIILLAPQILISTIFQRSAGVPFTPAEMAGPVAGFMVLGVVALWLFTAILRRLPKDIV
jgi:hypothetical protein